MPKDEQIVLIESFSPIKSLKIKYFEDKFFTNRMLPPTFIPTQVPYDSNKNKTEEEEAQVTGNDEGVTAEEPTEA